MSETCPVCRRALCRTALGDSTDYEQRAACYRIGYDNAAKVALELSVEVSEQKARADEAEAREATLADANAALADSVTRCAGIESDLAAARRNVALLQAALAAALAAPAACVTPNGRTDGHGSYVERQPDGSWICTFCKRPVDGAAPAAGDSK